MLTFLLFIIILGLCGYGFMKLDCHIYLWILDRFFSTPTYTAHLRGNVVWITGASSGIGEYMAYEFAKAGCRLVLSGTNQSRLDLVKSKCLSVNVAMSPSDILIIPFNISEYQSHTPALEKVLTQFKQLDILINNAGRSQRADFENIDITVDEDMFNINVFGPINLTRVVLNYWFRVNYPGQIAVTSSVAGVFAAPYSATYSATKFALHGYFESLRIEAYSKGIKVSLLCPGPTFSRILETSYTEKAGVQVNKSHDPDSKRMSTERCARLCFTAIVNRVQVAWISIQPILLACYVAQYLPSIHILYFTRFMSKEKLMKIREGK